MGSPFYRLHVAGALGTAILTGCGAQQVGSGSLNPGTPVFSAAARIDVKGGTLLYASVPATNSILVFKYPIGALVQELNGFDDPQGLCADAHGDVWIANADNARGNGSLVEYAHGGGQPIATLQDPNNAPQGCSVDPASGDLAVANLAVGVRPNIAVYAQAKGMATYYSTAGITKESDSITYAKSGDIYFADSRGHVGWLRAGSNRASKVDLTPAPRANGPILWDGLELGLLTSPRGLSQIWRYAVSGGAGDRGGIVKLQGAGALDDFWISGSGLAASGHGGVWLYNYPQGGPSTYLIKQASGAVGVTISKRP